MRTNMNDHMILPLVHLRTSSNVTPKVVHQLARDGQLPRKRREPTLVEIFDAGIPLPVSGGLGLELSLRDSTVRIKDGRPENDYPFFFFLLLSLLLNRHVFR
jgi:hypothetical protein